MNLDDPWDDSPPDTREVEVVRQKVKAEDEVEKYLVDEVRQRPFVLDDPLPICAHFCSTLSALQCEHRSPRTGARQRPNAHGLASERVADEDALARRSSYFYSCLSPRVSDLWMLTNGAGRDCRP
jgi:hypothetical protein